MQQLETSVAKYENTTKSRKHNQNVLLINKLHLYVLCFLYWQHFGLVLSLCN